MAKDDSHQGFMDGLVTFESGMDSGILPFLLARNQLAFATNCTVRGGFVTHRPVYQKIDLDFGSLPESKVRLKMGSGRMACTTSLILVQRLCARRSAAGSFSSRP